MNCVVIKASPRGSRAGSSRAADAFVRGLNAAGKEVDVTQLLLSKLKIRHCTGCYSCWTRTPGRCAQRDDMDRVLPVLDAADVVVYALPLYYYSVPGSLKDVIDRSLPLLCPQLVRSGDTTGHPRRTERAPRIVLIATCGFPERSHFDPLLQLVRQWTSSPDDEMAGTILIPAAEPMAHDDMQAGFRKLYDLIERAGRETANSGRVSPETEQLIEDDHEKRIGSAESFRAVANAYWESAQSSRGPSADEMRAESSSRKDPECSVSAGGMETLMAGMALRYDPPAADHEMTAIMQFDFEGDGYYLMISSGTCHAYRGFHPDPTFTVRSPVAVWEAVADGTLEGAAGLMSGRYHVDGDMSLFIRMNEFFAAGADPADVMELGDARPNRRPDSTPTPPAAGSGSRSARPAYGRGPLRFSVGVWMTIAFLPWTILWTASGFGSPPWSGYAALGTAALIGLYHVATNRMTLFEIGTLAYCAVHVALAGLGITLYMRYAVVFQHLFLAALWTGSLTRRFCLTAEYVRFEFPAVALRTAAFLDTNRILTAAWSIYYMVAGALHFVAATAPGASRAGLLVFALLVPMFGFNSWFQRWYPARLMARAPAGA